MWSILRAADCGIDNLFVGFVKQVDMKIRLLQLIQIQDCYCGGSTQRQIYSRSTWRYKFLGCDPLLFSVLVFSTSILISFTLVIYLFLSLQMFWGKPFPFSVFKFNTSFRPICYYLSILTLSYFLRTYLFVTLHRYMFSTLYLYKVCFYFYSDGDESKSLKAW